MCGVGLSLHGGGVFLENKVNEGVSSDFVADDIVFVNFFPFPGSWLIYVVGNIVGFLDGANISERVVTACDLAPVL